MGTLFRLSLRQLAGRRRLALIVLLAALPAPLSLWAISTDDNFQTGEFADLILDGLIFAVIVPVVMITLSTVAFGNEVEDRTLGYLVLKPVARWRIALPKLMATVAVAGPPLVLGGVAATLIAFGWDARVAGTVGVTLIGTVVTYSAIFTWAGLMTSRALGFTLVYVFLWEGILTTFLEGIRYLSVRGYAIAIMHALNRDSLETLGERSIEFPAAIGGAIIVTLAFFLLTVRRLRRMDIP